MASLLTAGAGDGLDDGTFSLIRLTGLATAAC